MTRKHHRITSFILALLIAVAALPLTAMPVSAADTPLACYDFASSYSDSRGNTSLYLDSYNASASFGTNTNYADSSYWYWNGSSATTGGGFYLNLGRALSTYTIITRFYYNDISSGYYRKIIDFKDRASDTGLYYSNFGYLHFYNYTASTNYRVSNGELVTVALTRNSSGYLTAYILTGANTFYEAFYVYDGSGNGIMNTNYLHFFHDNSSGGENATSGGVYHLRVYDYAMSSAQVNTAMVGSTLSYSGNGNTSGSVPAAKSGFIPASSHSALAASQGTLAKTGHTFTGWNTAAAGNGSAYGVGSRIYVTQNTALYAQWRVNSSTLTVNPGGGTWNSKTSAQSYTQIYNYGMHIPVPSRFGYTFAGWTRSNTYGYMTTLTAAANYTFGPTDGVTDYLTATWTANSYTISYNLDGGTVDSVNPQSASYHSGFLVSTPEKEGYAFEGWTVSDGLNTETAVFGTSASPATPITSSSFLCENGVDNLYFKNLTAVQNGSVTLTANWSPITFVMTLDPQGGASQTDAYTVTLGQQIPASVAVPVQQGYSFTGFFTEENGNGTRCYDENGSRTYQQNVENPADFTLYAAWTHKQSTVTLDPNGGTLAGDTASAYTGDSFSQISISDPEKGDLLFLRWELSGDNGTVTDGEGVTLYTFGPEAAAVTLQAVWLDESQAVVENNTAAVAVTVEGLSDLIDYTVDDTNRGITAYDRENATDIQIKLSVDDAPENSDIASNFSDNDSFPLYFDVEVKKTVTKADNTTVTTLAELDLPLLIKIDLSGELAGRNSYRVYRIHGEHVEAITDNPNNTEYYSVIHDENGNASQIWIRANKFSTYAVTALVTEVDTSDPDNRAGIDVTCRYISASSIAVYAVSIEWGEMQFNYSTSRHWDPEAHCYIDDYSALQIDEKSYALGNNEIKVTNDSNADVLVGISVIDACIEGVQMCVNTTNSSDASAQPATAMLLNKVPAERAPALSLVSYLRIDGTPVNMDAKNNKHYSKVASIVVTIEALGGELTPKDEA